MMKGRPAISLIACLSIAMVCRMQADTVTSGGTQWKNIDLRGMGFVTGILTHPTTGEIYARTDVAGIFRWDAPSSRWSALLDDLSNTIGEVRNVESFALDPANANRIFVAYGPYVEDGVSVSPADGIIRSDDKGLTWTRMNLPSSIEMGGNSEWRHCGERLVVDPVNSNVVYFGSRQDGLWRSTNGGLDWAQIAGVPVGGNNGATRNGQPVNGGITFVTPDSATTTSTNGPLRSSTVYLGIMDDGVYRSTDGGNTFSLLGTQPEEAASPMQGKLGSDGTLYVTLDNGVWRWRSNAWTVITPPVAGFTYSERPWAGLAVDPSNANRLAINATGTSPRDLFISSDAGATWIIHTTDPASAFPAGRHKAVTFVLPSWISEANQRFSWSGAITFAPGDSNQIWLTTGFGVYVYKNLTTNPVVADSRNFMTGLEELVGTRVLPLPAAGGGGVLAGVMDKSGFVMRDPEITPSAHIGTAAIANSTGLGISALTNTIVVSLASGGYSAGEALASDDGGQTWRALAKPFASNPSSGYGMTLGGDIAVSATNKNNFVWIPLNPNWYPNDHPPIFSTNGGASWTPTTGLPTFFNGLTDTYNGLTNVLAADAVNGSVFYAYHENTSTGVGSIYRSTDGGATWALRSNGGLPGFWRSILQARPGSEGELWYSNATTMLSRSTDGGATFTANSGWTTVKCFGFGAPLPGETKNTIYAVGTRGGIYGVYYSVNDGVSWVRPGGFGSAPLNIASSISGDFVRPGRIYMASGGRGLFYVDLYGAEIGTAPVFTTPATAASNPVLTSSTTLMALATDAESPASSLTYAWSATAVPSGGSVAFSATGTNAARDTTVTFSALGSYTLRCTVTDTDLRTSTSDITVVVQGALGALIIESAEATLSLGETQTYHAVGYTAQGLRIPEAPTVAWSVSGGGTMAADGTFTAGQLIGGPFTVTATSGAIAGTAQVHIGATNTALKAVHWLGSYGTANKNFRSSTTQRNVNLDGGSKNDDSRRFIAWSETIPYITPDSAYSGTSDRFYGGLQFCRFNSNTAPNSGAIPVAGVREGASTDVATNDAIGLNTMGNFSGATHAHFVWLKPDFLGTAATTALTFTSTSRLTLSVGDGGSDTIPRWTNITNARWLVREGTQWYVSQSALAGGTGDKVLTFASDSSDGNWAPVNPDGNLNLNLAGLTYSARNFSNLTGFGYYLENDTQSSGLSFYAMVDEFKVEVSPVLPPLAAWQNSHWPGTSTSAIVGPEADPDGDGLINLLEYALASIPTDPASRQLPSVQFSEGHLQFTFLRARADLTYRVEASSDLSQGSWTVISTNPGTVSLTNPITVTDTVNLYTTNPPNRFLRLRLSSP